MADLRIQMAEPGKNMVDDRQILWVLHSTHLLFQVGTSKFRWRKPIGNTFVAAGIGSSDDFDRTWEHLKDKKLI